MNNPNGNYIISTVVVLSFAFACAEVNPAASKLVLDKSIAARINHAAMVALAEDNYVVKNDVVKLYGTRTNGKDTNDGNWACAKVVTIVLREARVLKRLFLGVRQVERRFKNWKKILDEDQLRPGDIIVWVSRNGRKDKKCTGGGNCHVGIVTDNGYFHNSPITNKPSFDGISLWGFKFKLGLRPPN